MWRILPIILLLIPVLGANPARGQVSLDLALWDVQPGGTLSLGADGQAGTDADLEDDLYYTGSDRVGQAAAYIGQTHQLALQYLSYDASARSALPRPLSLGGSDYPAGAVVSTALDLQLIGVGYRYAGGDETFQSGFLITLHHAALEVESSAPDSARAKGDLTTLCPVIGVFADWRPAAIVGLQGTMNGGAWDSGSTSLTILDAQAAIRLLLYPFVAGLGYRHLAVQGDDTDVPLEFDLNFSGPVFFAGLAF